MNPTYSIKEAVTLILACNSMEEMNPIRNLLVQDIDSYPIADQGFLMAMIGIQIIKIEGDSDDINFFFRRCIDAFIQSTDN